jgi:hypothetical protein
MQTETETAIEIVEVVCRHCNRSPINRPRALCWNCYYAPGVKDLYPSTSPQRQGNGLGNKAGRLPAEPTDAQPGSERKIRVMEQRAARGESIFHPDDNVCR